MHRPRFCLIIALAIAPLWASAVSAEERLAANPAELADAIKAARSGDTIVMTDGGKERKVREGEGKVPGTLQEHMRLHCSDL